MARKTSVIVVVMFFDRAWYIAIQVLNSIEQYKIVYNKNKIV